MRLQALVYLLSRPGAGVARRRLDCREIATSSSTSPEEAMKPATHWDQGWNHAILRTTILGLNQNKSAEDYVRSISGLPLGPPPSPESRVRMGLNSFEEVYKGLDRGFNKEDTRSLEYSSCECIREGS